MTVAELKHELDRFPDGCDVIVACSAKPEGGPIGNYAVYMRPVHSIVFNAGDSSRITCLIDARFPETDSAMEMMHKLCSEMMPTEGAAREAPND